MQFNLKMFAIVDISEEGCYWNFDKEEISYDLNGQCLLPTYQMAEEYINEMLAPDYFKVIEVNVESISKIGTWVYNTTEDKIFG